MENNNYLLEKRLLQLDPELHQRFTDTVAVLHSALSGYKRLFPEYTDHSVFHSMNVLQFCNDLIGDEQIGRMNAYECYTLLMSCYLHDIGMGISEKMQLTLDLCRAVAEQRSPFRISQERVELNFIES